MNTPLKIQKVLKIFLIFFLAIVLRVWHLGVIQREDKLSESQRPQQRTILVKADRGSILDRFHIPLAVNRIAYNAAIYYSQITEIPSISWVSGLGGAQEKIYPRKQYIRNLSEILAHTLGLSAERIEDLIHSKAALFPHVPYILKADLSEKEHYRLRMLEKDWPGIYAEISQMRYYPQGKVACNIIGTMGAISHKEYSQIAQEVSELKAAADFGEITVLDRLEELKEKAYSINDLIGKTGVESQYEEELRGYFGKKVFEVDQKGRFVREINERKAIPGKELILSISSELQEFAERLLAQDERTRDGRSRVYDKNQKKMVIQKQPWIKGGAIVALDPNTGDILALASHPRFDPNDFIYHAGSVFNLGKTRQINRWLENEGFIGELWDGIESLTREELNFEKEITQPITWDFYLETILDKNSPVYDFLHSITVAEAISLQEDYEAIHYHQNSELPIPIEIAKKFDQLNFSKKDLLFIIDICRVAVYAPAFTDELIHKIGDWPLSQYREVSQEFSRNERIQKEIAKQRFHKTIFKEWKKENLKDFLKEKREFEKEKKIYARPYIDYLDKKENELFTAYWEKQKFHQLKTEDMQPELLRTFRSYSELKRPLLGSYPNLRNHKKEQTEKDLAAAFYPVGGYGFSKSYAFESGVPPGSVFKLVTAYEGLHQNKDLKIIDQRSEKGVAYTMQHKLYPRHYKGGRLPRSAARNMGALDLVAALERSSNPYFAILAGDHFNDPEDLGKAARLFGYGEKTGIDLPRETRGNIPGDLKTNRTGLYSASIGQHTFLSTPLQTANMLAAIANKGSLLRPRVVRKILGSAPDRHPLEIFAAQDYFAKDELDAIGIPFPLFTAMQAPFERSAEIERPPEIIRHIPMDEKIRNTLLKGMDQVVSGVKGSARPQAIKGLLRNPHLMKDYQSLCHQMVGKTGTAEILCKLSQNPSAAAQVYKYTWFGAISFTDAGFKKPDLAVVVFLRFSDSGKEAAPLASQVITKWREIQKKHSMEVHEY